MQAFSNWWPHLSSLYFEGVVSGQGLVAGGGGGGGAHQRGRAAAPPIMPPPSCMASRRRCAMNHALL